MKAGKNIIDNWVKKDLRLEVFYRTISWSLFTIATYVFSSYKSDFSVLNYYKSYTPTPLSILNAFLPLIIMLTAISIMFKDMDIKQGGIWSQEQWLGMFGAFFCKVSSEIMLWITGISYGLILITLITVVRVISYEGLPKGNELIKIYFFVSLFVIIFLLGSCAYILIRHEKGLILSTLSEVRFIPILCTLATLIAIGIFYIGF